MGKNNYQLKAIADITSPCLTPVYQVKNVDLAVPLSTHFVLSKIMITKLSYTFKL